MGITVFAFSLLNTGTNAWRDSWSSSPELCSVCDESATMTISGKYLTQILEEVFPTDIAGIIVANARCPDCSTCVNDPKAPAPTAGPPSETDPGCWDRWEVPLTKAYLGSVFSYLVYRFVL